MYYPYGSVAVKKNRFRFRNGSKNSVGRRFQWFEINELEIVDLTGASWNQHWHWLNRLDQIRSSALAT